MNNLKIQVNYNSPTAQNPVAKKLDETLKRSSVEVLLLNVLIPTLALISIGICLLPRYGVIPAGVVVLANFILASQIPVLTHELIHESHSKTKWNFLLRLNLHLYSPFNFGFAEYKRLHSLHHAHANNPQLDPDYFFTQGSRFRAFIILCFTPEYLFFYALKKGEMQPHFYALQAARIALFLVYIYIVGIQDFFFLFFVPSKISWGIGFLLFSYESHFDSETECSGNYNLEPQSLFLRRLFKYLVGPYGYYVAFSHASHHLYPQVSGRKIGLLLEHFEEAGIILPSRHII
jgi:fatty acid desaturase